jgi:hypothetical protein
MRSRHGRDFNWAINVSQSVSVFNNVPSRSMHNGGC